METKTPEGFAFYRLFPQQFALAALDALADASSARVLVVGIRSIGTTLSAVVSAGLRARGFHARRMTVRPVGHPYSRTVPLHDDVSPEFVDRVLVVDEGPGQSGSSMAGTVAALRAAGFARSQIVMLPGHAGEPGSAASDTTRRVWSEQRRAVSEVDDLRWQGESLEQVLRGSAESLLGSRVVSTRDLSGGRWREVQDRPFRAWPAAYPEWESTKILMAAANGERLLWKFYGLGVEGFQAYDRLVRRSEQGLCPDPLDLRLGFIATPWIEGASVGNTETGPGLKQIARHIHLCRLAPLGPDSSAAFHRLMQMVDVNLGEALGPAAARRALDLGLRIEPLVYPSLPGYGDGRMGPEEWVALPDGGYLKTDAAGHFDDHTYVGAQSVVWDLAGASVDWELDPAARAELLLHYERLSGHRVDYETLRFYMLAYCAFRLGMASFSFGSTGDPDSRAALARARGRYLRCAREISEAVAGAYLA